MKRVFLLLMVSLKAMTCISQDIVVDPSSAINFAETNFVKVYRCDRIPSLCYDTKNVSIIENSKISPCFTQVETLNKNRSNQLVAILTAKASYKKYSYYAFTTDYAIILFNKRKKIIGYINFSFVCSNLYSYPIISAQKSLSPTDLNDIGLSEEGKKAILKVLRIKV
jgi:hypothetical protein